MKAIAVSDAFITETDYRNAFSKFPEFTLTAVPFFGLPSREKMRDMIHTIERNGPEAVEPPQALYDLIEDAEVLMVHLCPVTRKLLQRAKKLRSILVNRGGTENIDVAAATEMGIDVLSNPAHNANAVAEYTVGLILAETRNIARADGSLRSGVWRERFPNSGRIFELRGTTIGLIGFGTIARLVARKLQGFDCRILVYDICSHTEEDAQRYGCRFVSQEELLQTADIVSLHVRCSKVVIGRKEFDMMKPGAYFINVSRPHLIDNDYLCRLLREGKLSGAALDVFPNEPLSRDEPFLTLDNITLSNHRGGDTVNSYSDSPQMLLQQLCRKLEGGIPEYWVNQKKVVS